MKETRAITVTLTVMVPPYGWKDRGEAPRRWLPSEPQLPHLGPRCGAGRHLASTPTRSLPGGNVPHPWDIMPGGYDPWDTHPIFCKMRYFLSGLNVSFYFFTASTHKNLRILKDVLLKWPCCYIRTIFKKLIQTLTDPRSRETLGRK